MEVMEKLYNRGFLSYPRTETNSFNPTINLKEIVSRLKDEEIYADFCQKLINDKMWGGPSNGNKDDKAHPPIHPVKLARDSDFENPTEAKIYEFVTRHFLACVSKDAVGL
jgi:DNA topoisomerase-3